MGGTPGGRRARGVALAAAVAAVAAVVAGCASPTVHLAPLGSTPASPSPQPSSGSPSVSASATASAAAGAGFLAFSQLGLLLPRVGWAALTAGHASWTLARTVDAGATWTPARLPEACGHFPTLPTDTFAAGASGPLWLASVALPGAAPVPVTVCRSVDGGTTWQVTGTVTTPGDVPAVQFLDAEHGWLTTAVLAGMHSPATLRLWATSDSGRTWRLVATSGDKPGQLLPLCAGASVTFVTTTVGYQVGGCAQGGAGTLPGWARDVAVTHDGGTHWQPVVLPHPSVPGGQAGCHTGQACTFVLVSATAGRVVLAAAGSGAPAVLWVSTDAGATWTVHPLPLDSTQVACSDGIDLVQVTPTSRTVALSADGGRSWQQHPDVLPAGLAGKPQVSGATVLVTVTGNRLARSTNSGHTWTLLSPALTGP